MAFDNYFIRRFWSKLTNRDLAGCWLWQGVIGQSHGYGIIKNCGKSLLTHRVSWEMHNGGAPPEGLCVLHKCDVRPCVNPAHLFLGTKGDNARDMCAKGRHAMCRGEDTSSVKLTDEQVIWARYWTAMAGLRRVDVAEALGISQAQVSNIITGYSWSHLPVWRTKIRKGQKRGLLRQAP